MNKGMTKGNMPTSKPGGMKSHLGSSAGNNPKTSRDVSTGFSGKNMPKCSDSPRHHTAKNHTGGEKS